MRRLALGAALAAVALSSSPTSALVKPGAGSALPDFDIRKDTADVGRPTDQAGAASARDIASRDNLGTIRPVVMHPDAGQWSAVERLRRDVSPALYIDFRESNALPRQLHAWGKPLTAAAGGDVVALARAYLKANADLFKLTSAEVDALVVARNAGAGSPLRTVWLAQVASGVMVQRGDFRFNFDKEGRLLWVASGDVVPGLRAPAAPRLSTEEAVAAAAEAIGRGRVEGLVLRSTLGSAQTVYSHPDYLGDIVVQPVLFPLWRRSAALGWQVMLEPRAELPQWYAVTVDGGSGKLLERVNLYKYATNEGLVFAGEHPDTLPNPPFTKGVPQTRAKFGYNWPSTGGWTIPAPYSAAYGTYLHTIGNNVDAKEDWLRDNEASIGLHADGGALQEWLFPFTDAYQQSTQSTRAGRIADAQRDVNSVITNLFYWNNFWHDYTHNLGFSEAYGNFQWDNYSRGGCGRDAVFADAMDGAVPATGNPSLNNANFGTPPEPLVCAGTIPRPRMNMFLWELSSATVLRDGDLDASIIIHEYHHGISTRLVGGPYTNCLGGTQSGAMGEGGGDFEAASMFDRPSTGEYAVNDPVYGIRNYPMDANPRTYADLCSLGGCQVHNDGEIHASTMWDVRGKVGKAVVEQLAIDAYKLSVCSPSFLDYRDAMILADENRYAGVHVCPMWDAYVARGMGFDAKGSDSAYHVADFLFRHPKCSGFAHLRYNLHTTSDTAGGNGDGLYAVGETIDLNVELQNFDGVATATGVSATVGTTTPGITLVQATRSYPNIPAGGKASPTLPFQFRIDPTFLCGSPIDFTITMNWAPALTRGDIFSDRKGSVGGVVLAGSDAEGTPLATSAPAAVSSAQNHTPGGANSYWMLSGCYAGDEIDCLGTGPCNDTCPTITLPSVSLPAYQSTWLTFWETYNNEYLWDGTYAEISDDGGVTWQPVASLNYPGTIAAQANGCNFVNDIQAVSGPAGNASLSGWTLFQGDLTPWAGKNVILRLREHHDGCIYFQGGYVDDIQLQVQNCTTAPFVNCFLSNKVNQDGANPVCTDNDNNPDAGETVDAQISVTNTGNTTVNTLTGTLTTTNPNIVIVSGPQAFGNLAPGQAGTATFRYTVNNPGPGCFEPADFTLALSGNGGSYSQNIVYTETLRQDPGNGSWLDTFEGSRPPWTAALGPNGTAQDFALRELDCLTAGGNRWFWATNQGMVRTVCATGEPDYSNDSDSVLTSPLIDLGAPGHKLLGATWNTFAISTSVDPGFVEVSLDHDNDGVFTLLWYGDKGLGGLNNLTTDGYLLDIQNNPAGNPVPATSTAQFVRWQFRFRSNAPDPGATGGTVGMIINDFQLSWQQCDVNACAPGVPPRIQAPRIGTTGSPLGVESGTGARVGTTGSSEP